MRACGGWRALLGTLPLRLTRLSLCFSLLRGVAWHVTYLHLYRRTGALGGGVCGSLRAYFVLCLRRHVCRYVGGIALAPYESGLGGWACSLGYTLWSPLLVWLSLCFSRLHCVSWRST